MGILLEEGYTYLNKYIYIYIPDPWFTVCCWHFMLRPGKIKKKTIINSCLPFFLLLITYDTNIVNMNSRFKTALIQRRKWVFWFTVSLERKLRRYSWFWYTKQFFCFGFFFRLLMFVCFSRFFFLFLYKIESKYSLVWFGNYDREKTDLPWRLVQ